MSFLLGDLFSKKTPGHGRSLRTIIIKQIMTIPRPKSGVDWNTLWIRGPVIWNKLAKFPESLTSCKNTNRKLHANFEVSLNKEAVVIAKKSKDFIYF